MFTTWEFFYLFFGNKGTELTKRLSSLINLQINSEHLNCPSIKRFKSRPNNVERTLIKIRRLMETSKGHFIADCAVHMGGLRYIPTCVTSSVPIQFFNFQESDKDDEDPHFNPTNGCVRFPCIDHMIWYFMLQVSPSPWLFMLQSYTFCFGKSLVY